MAPDPASTPDPTGSGTTGADAAAAEAAAPANAPRLRWADPAVRTFSQLLVNVLLVSVINYTVWFAITFFVYLETRSVFATGVIAGIFLVATVGTGIWFGSLVDHHRKKTVMQVSALVVLLMVGVIAGNLRSIALPTVVTAMFDEGLRDRANGLVGTTLGISFLVTSVISGILVGWNGMLGVLVLAVVVIAVALPHLQGLKLPAVLSHAAAEGEPTKTDLRGTIRVVRGIPGMVALILFAAMNNLLGGAFMALMDAYGLSMMSVQAWGLVWGALSALMIVGGLLIARTGLGSNPVRLLLGVNVVLWGVTVIFPLRDSAVWLVAGLAVYMLAMPYVEASEQTVLQKVVPYERQGRVFGFAPSG